MRVFDAAGKDLMMVKSIERDSDDLVLRGKILGSMPMVARIRPEEVRAAFKLLDVKTMVFIATMIFRRPKRS